MGDIVEGRVVGEFPPLIAVLALRTNRQHGRNLAVARDEVFPRRQRKGGQMTEKCEKPTLPMLSKFFA